MTEGEDRDQARLQDLLLSGPPVFTLGEAEAKTGIPAEDIGRMWRALGFAIAAADEAVFNEHDLHTLEVMNIGVSTGRMDLDTQVRIARAVGQTMARLADWQVSTLSTLIDSQIPRGGDHSGRVAGALDISEEFGDAYDEVLVYSWRRHMGAALQRLAALDDLHDDSHTVVRTIGFADLVQFSALSNQLDDNRIGELVEIFETRAADVVNHLGGRVIKTLGDSVLFLAEDPVVGMDIAQRIVDIIGDDSRLPDVHLGIATGSVLLRFGDVFGPPVNLAARLTGIARRNRVIADAATAAVLPASRYESRVLTARPVRGFGVVEPIAVRRV